MNGKKLRKIALITAAILVGLFVTLMVVAKLVITPERVRRTVLPMAEKALHRPVTIGDIRVSIFSGIVIDKLTIGEEQGKNPFVTAERVKLSYRFWPLLRGEVVVNEVELVAPLVRVVRRGDGSFNFSDLAAPKEKPAQAETKAPPSTGKGIDLRVATFTLSKGTIIYEAAAPKGGAPFSLTVSDIHVEATDFALDRPFSVKLSAQLPVAKVAVAGSVNLADGTSIDLEAKVMDADLARLATLLPPAQAASLRPLNLAGILNLRLKLAGPVSAGMDLVKDGELRLANLQATAGGLRPDISGTIQIAGRRVAAKELTVVVADNRLTIDFTVPDLTAKPTRLTCNVAASN
ncbi:MAG TPA: AsmA family protein, partial [Geobacterales bacterium]|nr:AsmA family protein [Geobacterales bacterium]